MPCPCNSKPLAPLLPAAAAPRRVIDAGEYAQFPVCSKDGALKNNYARGCADAAFYVGKSFGCDIAYNRAEGCVAGSRVLLLS
jgi:hypothetical protein